MTRHYIVGLIGRETIQSGLAVPAVRMVRNVVIGTDFSARIFLGRSVVRIFWHGFFWAGTSARIFGAFGTWHGFLARIIRTKLVRSANLVRYGFSK